MKSQIQNHKSQIIFNNQIQITKKVWILIIDGLVKSLKRLSSVIPAQAGIQSFYVFIIPLDSRFHGNDNFLRIHHDWKLFGYWPACAKPLRQRQVLGI